jgi:transaldolase
VETAHQDLRTLAELGVDMDAVTDQLQREGVDKFIKSFRELIGSVESKLARVAQGA